MGVSLNGGTPKSSHFTRGFHYFHLPFWGYHYFRKPPYIDTNFPMNSEMPMGFSEAIGWSQATYAEVDLGMVMVLSSRHRLMRR